MPSLHPELQAILDRRAALDIPGFADGTPADARAAFAEAQVNLPHNRGAGVRRIENLSIAGRGGPVPVRRYVPKTQSSNGRILYFHGGGWVFGTLDAFDPVCRELADASGAEVFSVDYRLAPEHPFPQALDDGWDALRALSDGNRPFALAGDSAGGNIAAALALRASAGDGPRVDLQLLLYPVLSPTFDTASYRDFGNGDYLISKADMEWFWDHYVAKSERNNPEVSPILSSDLSALPETIIVLAGCDPLHDEGVAYAEALRAAGVNVTLRDHPDMAHGFFTLVDLIGPANAEVRTVGALMQTCFRALPSRAASA